MLLFTTPTQFSFSSYAKLKHSKLFLHLIELVSILPESAYCVPNAVMPKWESNLRGILLEHCRPDSNCADLMETMSHQHIVSVQYISYLVFQACFLWAKLLISLMEHAQDNFRLYALSCLANILPARHSAFAECLIQLSWEPSSPSNGQGWKDTKCAGLLYCFGGKYSYTKCYKRLMPQGSG